MDPSPFGGDRQPLTNGERAMNADAPLHVLDASARLLHWPNTIGAADRSGWVGERAEWMPSTADPKFTVVIEVHDPGQPDNRNAILTTRLGRGEIVYITLTLDQQISGGVPGGLRLLVNMLSAGPANVPQH